MPKTLLLADDSVTIQKVVGITFANEDIDLVTENNGDAALARARELSPDIILADISMPGLNGYELCEAIKSEPTLAHVPVILLTGTFESYDEQRTREVGADGHIAKPFEAQALVDLVHSTLDRAGAAATALGQTMVVPVEPAPEAMFRPEAQPAHEAAAALPSIDPMPSPSAPLATDSLSQDTTVVTPGEDSADHEPGFAFADFKDPAGAPSGEATRVFDPAASPMDLEPPAQLVTPDSPQIEPPRPSIDPTPSPALGVDFDSGSDMDTVLAPAPVVEPPSLDAERAPMASEPSEMETMLAPAPVSPAEPEVDAVLYEETSFLDPRAALNSSESDSVPMVSERPMPVGDIAPLGVPARMTEDDNPDSEIFGEPLCLPGSQSSNEDTAPEMAAEARTIIAAEEALEAVSALPEDAASPLRNDDVADPVLDWVEPLEPRSDSITDADPPLAPEPVLDAPSFSEHAPAFSEPAPSFSEPAPMLEPPELADIEPVVDPLPEPEFMAPAPTFGEPEPERELDEAELVGEIQAEPLPEPEPSTPISMGVPETVPKLPKTVPNLHKTVPKLPRPEAPEKVEIDSAEMQAALERVAWEAFGSLSEQLVGEVTKKIEEIAWEVVPQLAEKLIQDEIEKLKRGD